MTVLAVLAHEFGHVLWYDTFRPTAGGPYDFDTFCDGTFFVRSWRHTDKPPEWRNFGDAQNSHVPSDADADVVDIALALVNQTPGLAGDLLERLYRQKARWASLFAAFSPDEDFVETFKFYIVTNNENNNNPLISLPINITGSTTGYNRNIPDNYAKKLKPILSRKIRCFTDIYP
jgi:hypothetical protein